MIQTVKHNEQLRREYHILPAVLMDAFDEGEARGKSIGLAEGEARGRSEGSHQKALETAKKSPAIWTFSGKDRTSHRPDPRRDRINS